MQLGKKKFSLNRQSFELTKIAFNERQNKLQGIASPPASGSQWQLQMTNDSEAND